MNVDKSNNSDEICKDDHDIKLIQANSVMFHLTIILENITLSEDEVLPVIIYRDNNKAQGPDGIPARLLKETAKQIAPSLCMLFDKSLRVCHVPDDWKVAYVVPIHKKEEVTYVENYRPISLLSFISIKYLNVAF